MELAPLWELLPQAGEHEQRLCGLTDDELTAAAQAAGDDAEICACGREAARRALGERPYDVQLAGALAMLSGLVAEMGTGEGKTLSGALAAAGYALRGRSVHVMSVNDYLARRDAEWMRPVYDLLGVSVGWIGQASTVAGRRRAYAAQVTYAPVSEFGFDVLRDRLVTDVADLVAGDPDVVVIDEADSVLIDEARVPLVLAGAADSADADREMATIAAELDPGQHYEVDEDARNVYLTSAGARAAEESLGGIDLYTAEQAEALTRLNVALHAHALLQRDVDYIVRDGAVHLINESRGRVARRQRWPDGLHAAVEAKEGLAASDSGEILDSITIQSLVRRYRTVCGMTGTAVAAGEQIREFYGLEIAVIPPNRPCIRTDEPDRLYPTIGEKEQAVIGEVADAHATGRPVLIGTLDVAESERLAGALGRAGLQCTVLNAKNDAQEAAIVAEAGAYGAITVSTQMAGRGTDIRLGGSGGDRDLIAELGGLYVIGTGRHASSRLDKQLRGRAGRQGDPGGSVFLVSMEDELVHQYAPDEVRAQVSAPKAHWALGHAQRVAEGVNLEIHRNTWQYNKLVEDQRRIVLDHRARVLRGDDALSALSRQCPERLAELSPGIDGDVLAGAARQIVLFHLDRAWADHLAFLADLREGIHLRALARGTVPLNEFNKEAIRAFRDLLEQAAARSAQTFRTAPITAEGVDLEAIGLKRPTSTWTYLVHDNPFGTDIDRALRSVARRIRKLVLLSRTGSCVAQPGTRQTRLRRSRPRAYDDAVADMWAETAGQAEVPLAGGDVTAGVVRVGDTVRRPVGPHSPLVHALLAHLEAAGFEGAPRFLGIDRAGREVLSYVDGEVAGRPRPPWIADETRLASVGRLVRAYDDAAASFTVPPDVVPDTSPADSRGMPPAPAYPPELIGHVDITPENVVFRDGLAYALIDFDLAKPATRADEVFNAMLWWGPLFDPRDVDPLLRHVDVPRRIRILADSYGLSATDRERIMEVAVLRTRRAWHLMKLRAQTEGGGWQRMWDEGVGDAIKRREAWLDRHAAMLTAALTAP